MTVDMDSGFPVNDNADDDYTAIDSDNPLTVLEGLRQALSEKVDVPPLTLPVPGRKNVSVEFDLDIDANVIPLWQKRCRDRRMPDEIDNKKFSMIVVADRTRAIKLNDKTVVDPATGKALTFQDRVIQDMFGASRAFDAIKAMYTLDSAILQTAKRIMQEAGFGDEVADWDDDADPTRS